MNLKTDDVVPADRGGPMGADALVDTAWLAAHLDDSNVRVVEVDVNPKAFDEGHIDGAVLWDIYADLKDGDYHTIDEDSVQGLLRRSGIDEDTTVVVYGYGPALGFWLLTLAGHHDVRMLDASRDTWRMEGRPWTDRIDTPSPTDYRLQDGDPMVRATPAVVERAITASGVTIVDVRSVDEFIGGRFWPSGAMEPGARAGHVPGAVHLVADDLHDGRGAFRSRDELSDLFAPLGVRDGHEVITYCTIGARASTTWFVLTHLLAHPNVRVYDGSWAEWGRTPGAPVVTGPA